MHTVRIGSGAGYSGDRIDPAVELADKGSIDYLVFECLAERTIALAQKDRLTNLSGGFDPLLEERLGAVLPLCTKNKIRIVSNMGAANPLAAAARAREIAQRLGLRGIRIAAVTGDDVLSIIRSGSFTFCENGRSTASLSNRIISANAYLGAEPIVEALAGGADVVLTGRVSDPSLFLAPLIHEFGWSITNWILLGQGTVIGHLLECAGQLTGGYFADPGYKTIPRLARLGFPIAEVSRDGTAIITKVEGSGGWLSKATCTEQLLYEIQDPAAYLTPDVVADFSQVQIEQQGDDRIRIYGGTGRARPATLKVSVGFQDGFVGEGQISYAGPGALSRAELARKILVERLKMSSINELQCDLIGINSIYGERLSKSECEPCEVRLRVVGRSDSRRDASLIPREVEALYTNGPAGGGGVSGYMNETVGILSTMVPRDIITHKIDYEVS
jgi:hypothetical protein